LKVACNGLLSTIGRVTFDGKVKHPFTAHPKVDPATGECFYIGYNPTKAPFAWYGMLDPQGNVVRDFPVPLPAGIMMHDFAITEDYAILIDAPLLFKPEVVVKYKTLPFWFDKERPTRFGVLPRYSKDSSDVRWFEVPAVMMFHVSAAWQEGNKIHLFTACFDEFSIDFDTKERARRAAEGKQTSLQHLTEFILDLDTGKATQRWATDAATTGDFPVIPHSLMGRKVKYSYLALTKDMDNNPHFYGVAKIDMQATDKGQATVGKLQYGDSTAGGEAFFCL
jgi:carotenoid cleavage dioxygenase